MPYEISKKKMSLISFPTRLYSFDGEGSKNIYAKRGISKNRLLITGPARFDSIWEKARKSKLDSGFPRSQ